MSSFKRRGPSASAHASLPATRISARNSSVVLTSTGVPSIDELLGGGLPLHTSLLVNEDRFTGYAKLLMSYYIAQGVASGHAVSLATADEDPESIIRGLMGVVEGKVPSEMKEEEEDEDVTLGAGGAAVLSGRRMGATRNDVGNDRMQIAWRYQGLPRFSTAVGGAGPARAGTLSQQTPFCNLFDLTKRMTPAMLKAAGSQMALLDISAWALEAEETGSDNVFQRLIRHIEGLVDEGGFRIRPNGPPPPTLLRIAIHSIASPLWGSSTISQLSTFFLSLRSILRTSYATAFISLPNAIPPHVTTILSHLSDGVLRLDSFAGSSTPVHSAYESQYHGFLDIVKVPRVASLGGRIGEMGMLGFKVRRKRFLVERCTLPPEGEGVRRGDEEEGSNRKARSSCGTVGTGNNPLDF
ncbi:Elongator complex protein 4 [Fimicolochytrium jonesii]|uniref:Elongator complex protein 4 n=1 Tax=Fimicolochytrium jonesii TaxID=1396493 RepID=UPI0022FF2305|nr:Elongator complex protein 4 [Fimicolochytrium jonesii]KAI8822511.1 Elongator complex protein 4 [Fimicolochytrium jonesii]